MRAGIAISAWAWLIEITMGKAELCALTDLIRSMPPPSRKLPHLRDKQRVELSGRILPGGSNEEITIYGKSDCWDIEGS